MICKKCKADLPIGCFRKHKNKVKNRHGNGVVYEYISIRKICKKCENRDSPERHSKWAKTEKGKTCHKNSFKKWYDKEKQNFGDKYTYVYFMRDGLKASEIPQELIDIKKQLNILKQNIKNYQHGE